MGFAKAIASVFIRTADKLSHFSAVLAACALLAISVLMLLEILTRSVWGFSLQISWEISSYLLASLFFLAAPYTLLTRGHIRVSLLLETLPRSWGAFLDFVGTVLGIGVSFMLAWVFSELTLRSLKHHSISATPLEVPLVYPQACVTIGAGLLFLQFVARLARILLDEPPDKAAPTI